MSFATAQPVPRYPLDTSETPLNVIKGEDGWPDVDPKIARVVLRLNGTVTNERLNEALVNAIQAIQKELSDWYTEQDNPTLTPRQQGLYRRAVFFTAKADLMERYRDFDMTQAGDRVADASENAIDDAWRTVRWAISDFLGKSRVTVEVL